MNWLWLETEQKSLKNSQCVCVVHAVERRREDVPFNGCVSFYLLMNWASCVWWVQNLSKIATDICLTLLKCSQNATMNSEFCSYEFCSYEFRIALNFFTNPGPSSLVRPAKQGSFLNFKEQNTAVERRSCQYKIYVGGHVIWLRF